MAFDRDQAVSEEARQACLLDTSSAIQPNRAALEKRAAACRQLVPPKARLARARALFTGLFALATLPVRLVGHVEWLHLARSTSAMVTGAASALIITKACTCNSSISLLAIGDKVKKVCSGTCKTQHSCLRG